MSIEIRPFRNTDAKSIATVRSSYLEFVYGKQICSDNECLASWTDFVESKLFFNPANLLIASLNQCPIGWMQSIHIADRAIDPDNDTLNLSKTLFIDSLAVDATNLRLSDLTPHGVGNELLNATIQLARRSQIERIVAGRCESIPTHYIGVAPDHAIVGIPTAEQTFHELLAEHDFQSTQQRASYRLDLTSFRPTFSRDLLKVRRASRVASNPGASHTDWVSAVALAQADETTFTLTDTNNVLPKLRCLAWRSSGRSLAANPLDFFLSERSLLDSLKSSAEDHARVRFLISEICTSLKSLGARSLTIGLDTAETDAIELLRQTGFDPLQTGVLFEKNLLD